MVAYQNTASQSENIDSAFVSGDIYFFLSCPRTYLVPGMTDCGVSLHCYGESQVDGAGHGDLSQRQNHTHQAQVAAVGQQARRVQSLILESFTLGKSTKYIPQFF